MRGQRPESAKPAAVQKTWWIQTLGPTSFSLTCCVALTLNSGTNVEPKTLLAMYWPISNMFPK